MIKFFKKGFYPSNEDRAKFPGIVMSDGIFSSDEENEKVVAYFTEIGAFEETTSERHQELQSSYDLFRALEKAAFAEGRENSAFTMMDRAEEVQKVAQKEGYELK